MRGIKKARPIKLTVIYKNSAEAIFGKSPNHTPELPLQITFETTAHGKPLSMIRRLIKKAIKIEYEISRLSIPYQFYKKLDADPGIRFGFRFISETGTLGSILIDGKFFSFNAPAKKRNIRPSIQTK